MLAKIGVEISDLRPGAFAEEPWPVVDRVPVNVREREALDLEPFGQVFLLGDVLGDED
jgi:hypothetical protein